MPRDEFERLERRWREQPLFLPRRRRLPWWPLALFLAVLVVALVGQQPTAGLIERVQRVLAVGGATAPAQAQTDGEAGSTGAADAGFAQAPGVQKREPGVDQD
jgi:hypothetical protein